MFYVNFVQNLIHVCPKRLAMHDVKAYKLYWECFGCEYLSKCSEKGVTDYAKILSTINEYRVHDKHNLTKSSTFKVL